MLTCDDLQDRNFFSLCLGIKTKQTKEQKNPREQTPPSKKNNTTKNKIKFTNGFLK